MVPAPSAASSSSTPRTPRTSSSRGNLGRLRRPGATKPTARAGPPAPPAPTGSTKTAMCSATSSTATMTTTRMATATTRRRHRLRRAERPAQDHDPTERKQRIEARLGRHDDSWTETSGGVPANDVDLKPNTFTARYNITDDDQELARPAHQRLLQQDQPRSDTLLRKTRSSIRSPAFPSCMPAGSHIDLRSRHHGIDIWNTSRFETGAASRMS